jgi:hypothetical protein
MCSTCNRKVLFDGLCVRHHKGPCSVCLEPVSSVNRATSKRLTCGHAFHMKCIMKWFVTSDECPSCRTPQPNDPLITFRDAVKQAPQRTVIPEPPLMQTLYERERSTSRLLLNMLQRQNMVAAEVQGSVNISRIADRAVLRQPDDTPRQPSGRLDLTALSDSWAAEVQGAAADPVEHFRTLLNTVDLSREQLQDLQEQVNERIGIEAFVNEAFQREDVQQVFRDITLNVPLRQVLGREPTADEEREHAIRVEQARHQ